MSEAPNKSCYTLLLLICAVRSETNMRKQQKPNMKPIHIGALAYSNQKPHVGLTVAPIERGVYVPERLVLISETQLFGRQVLQTRRRRQSGVSEEFLVKSVTEMTQGSPIVHIEHGIGRYNGLIILDVGDGEQEFIHLKYADDASIYVPVANLQMISRYSGGDPALAP